MKRMRFRVLAMTAALLLSGVALAQHGDMTAIREAFRQNEDELRAYTWKSRTEVTLDAELKESTLYQVRLGPYGTFERTPIPDPEQDGNSRQPSKKMRQLFEKLKAAIHSYTHPNAEQRRYIFDHGSLTLGRGEMERMFHLQATGVIKTGDTVDLWVDGASKRPRRLEVMTSLEGEPLRLRIDFVEQPDGPSFPAGGFADTELKEKKLRVQVETFDYQRATTP
jgi:hypothetical protein